VSAFFPAANRAEAIVVSATCSYVVLLAYATTVWDYDIWGGMVVAPVLVLITLPLLRRIADKDGLPGLYPLLVAALVVKLIMAVPRWAVAFVLYDGSADASSYNDTARQLAPIYRGLSFPLSDQAGGLGTQILGSIAGAVYAIIGPTLIGGFLVFSWIGFLGLLLCYRAARIALPALDGMRYAALLFFLPSMVFWPSSIGKEAIITPAIGLVLYGAARSFTRLRMALPCVVAGLVVAYGIRPHIAALLAASFAAGYLVRASRRRTPLTPIFKIVGVILISLAGLYVVSRAAQSLGVESTTSAIQQLDRQGELTTQGGSSFQASPVRRPQDLPGATLAVLFRPFPWEAGSAQVLIASAESTGVLLLIALSWRRVATGLANLRNPYILMTAIYLLGFIVAFSQFGNFGILARQRVQAMPLLLVFLALPPLPRRTAAPRTTPTHPLQELTR
jgi:hypothetical protein